jgi:predicted nucleotidyltransferase
MTESQFKQYLSAVREQTSQPEPIMSERTELLQQVKQVAKLLKSQFDVQRVILFGSLAHQAWFTPDSDIDLAVQGLPSSNYWQAWRAIEEIITNRKIDLVEIETVSPTLKRIIEQDGIEL